MAGVSITLSLLDSQAKTVGRAGAHGGAALGRLIAAFLRSPWPLSGFCCEVSALKVSICVCVRASVVP